MTRHAQCQCGALSADAEGDHEAVVLCSCLECQARSGSAFGLGVYYKRAQVSLKGEAREYVRVADSGKPFHQFFCPSCATTLYWHSDRDPERIGIAVGAFGDAHFPPPARSVFEERKHAWFALPADMPGFIRGRDSERTR
jgi:hypothetical protein